MCRVIISLLSSSCSSSLLFCGLINLKFLYHRQRLVISCAFLPSICCLVRTAAIIAECWDVKEYVEDPN